MLHPVAKIISLDRNRDRARVAKIGNGPPPPVRCGSEFCIREADNKMNKTIVLAISAALLLLVPCAFGQNTNMYFNGGYQGSNWTYGSETVATGFYDGSINGVNVGPGPAGQTPGMICDDFKDNITTGESWTATAINASTISSNLGGLLFGSSIGVTGYTEVAYLVYQMFNPLTPLSPATEAAYSEAIWALTGGVSVSALTGQALTFYNNAKAGWSSMTSAELATLWIYTPNPRGPNEAQEMWGEVPVPEGGSALAYLLLAGIFCFTAIFRSRKQRCLSAYKA